MLIAGRPEVAQEAGREHLHVAGEDEQVDPRRAARAPAAPPPPWRRPRPARGGRGGRATSTWSAWSGWLETTATIVGAELAAAPAPEQVGEAVVLARDHDRDPLALARLLEAVVHLQRPRDLLLEAAVDGLALAVGHRVEDHPHEEPPLAAGVLVGVDDVEPGVGEEAADRGDQPRPVGAGEQQARCRAARRSANDGGLQAVFAATQEVRARSDSAAKWRLPLRA